MAKHALLSASGAHRWLECTPSALLELQFPQSTSEYAEEGTAAHELCELTARYFLGEVSEMDFENRRDELAKGPYYNAEMQECANDYARFVTEKTKAVQESCEDAFTDPEANYVYYCLHKFKWPPNVFLDMDPYTQAFIIAAIDIKVEKKEAAKAKQGKKH